LTLVVFDYIGCLNKKYYGVFWLEEFLENMDKTNKAQRDVVVSLGV